MDTKTTSIVAYMTFVGLIIALLAGDKEGAKFHINQALVVCLAYVVLGIASGVLSHIPFVGGISASVLGILLLVCWILGLVAAINQEEKEIPVLGSIKILN